MFQNHFPFQIICYHYWSLFSFLPSCIHLFFVRFPAFFVIVFLASLILWINWISDEILLQNLIGKHLGWQKFCHPKFNCYLLKILRTKNQFNSCFCSYYWFPFSSGFPWIFNSINQLNFRWNSNLLDSSILVFNSLLLFI